MSSTPLPPAAPLPPPSQHPPRNTALWWILGILGGGIVILGFVGLTIAGLVVRHLHVSKSGDTVAIETPVGAIKVNKGDTHATGLAVYPGATLTDDKSHSVEIDADDSSVGIAAEEYRTGDALEKVRAWYSKKLGPDFHMETGTQHGARSSKDSLHVGNHTIAFVDDRGNGARIVALDSDGGGTKITLFRAGKREPQ
jgi:hypothetical protein